MPQRVTYHDEQDVENTLKLREVLKTLPGFCRDYFRAMEPTTSTKTRISYAYDIRVFFRFLKERNPALRTMDIRDFPVDVLDQLEAVDIEEYQEYLKVYEASSCDKQITNGERGLKRKMSALRSFYTYYYKRQVISSNPTLLVDMPKIHEKSIIRLEANETAALLDYIEHGGDELTGQRKMYYEKTKARDLAIVTLLLGTGIRVSEVQYITMEAAKRGRTDIFLKGKIRTILLPEKLCRKLLKYAQKHKTASGEIFLTRSGRSLSRRQIWAEMKQLCRYAGVEPGKVFPHNFRHLFATIFYRACKDIVRLADVLGHSSIETTRIYLTTSGAEHAQQLNRLGLIL